MSQKETSGEVHGVLGPCDVCPAMTPLSASVADAKSDMPKIPEFLCAVLARPESEMLGGLSVLGMQGYATWTRALTFRQLAMGRNCLSDWAMDGRLDVERAGGAIRGLLERPAIHHILYYTGAAEAKTGDWMLYDGVFRFENFLEIVKACPQQSSIRVIVDCSYSGMWADKSAALRSDKLRVVASTKATEEASESPAFVIAMDKSGLVWPK